MNGVEPLVIPASSCHVLFFSDGSNHDWGYRFTVEAVVAAEPEAPRRPAFPDMALLRLLKVHGCMGGRVGGGVGG